MTFRRRDTLAMAAGIAVLAAARHLGYGRAAAASSAPGDERQLRASLAAMRHAGSARIDGGIYRLTKPLIVPPGRLEGGAITLDFRHADPADFPDRACVLIQGGKKSELPRLAADLAPGARSFIFSGRHGLAAGDTFQLSGTVDFAGNGYRPYYRKGEMFRVARVKDAFTVESDAPCRDTYAAAEVTAWKRAGDSFFQQCASLTVLANGAIDMPIFIDALDASTMDNLRAEGGKHSAIAISDCFGLNGMNVAARQISSAIRGYGIFIGNSQNVRLAGQTYGHFNGIAVGGGRTAGGKVGMNRDIHFEGTAASDPTGGLSGGNFHGNTENSSYRGTFFNGIVLAGNRNEAHGEFIGGSGRPAIQFGEMHGHDFHVSGTARTTGSDLPNKVGAIHQPGYGTHARYGGRTILDLKLDVQQATRILWWRPSDLARSDAVLELRLDVLSAHPKTRIMALRKNVTGRDFPRIEFARFTLADNRIPITWSVDTGTRMLGNALPRALVRKR